LYVTYVGGHVVTIETTSRRHRTSLHNGNWGPGAPPSRVKLPGFHQDFCGGGLCDGSSRRVVTIVNASGELIANVWITLVPYYNACESDNTEPSFPPPTETESTGQGEFTLSVDNQPNGDGSV